MDDIHGHNIFWELSKMYYNQILKDSENYRLMLKAQKMKKEEKYGTSLRKQSPKAK